MKTYRSRSQRISKKRFPHFNKKVQKKTFIPVDQERHDNQKHTRLRKAKTIRRTKRIHILKSVNQQVTSKIQNKINQMDSLKDSQIDTKELLDLAVDLVTKSTDINFKNLRSCFSHIKECRKCRIQFVYDFAMFKTKKRLGVQNLIAFLVILLENKGDRLRNLLQIKSQADRDVVTNCLALYCVLSDKKVDIMVKDDRTSKLKFFNMKSFLEPLDISVSFVGVLESRMNDKDFRRRCYSADIVFGTCNQFILDDLSEFFFLEPVRFSEKESRKRPFDCLILDGVEPLLVDQVSQYEINGVESLIVDPSSDFVNLQYLKEHSWEVEMAKEIIWSDLIRLLSGNNQDHLKQFKYIFNDLKTEVDKSLQKSLNLQEVTKATRYINKNLEKWISSAIVAFVYLQPGEHYVVSRKDNNNYQIEMINQNTFLVNRGQVFSAEIRGFIERKEGLRPSPEVVPCFSRSASFYVKCYRSVTGFSGFIGGELYRNLLKTEYEMESFLFDKVKKDEFLYDKYLFVKDQNEYFKTIVQKINSGDYNIFNKLIVVLPNIPIKNLVKRELDLLPNKKTYTHIRDLFSSRQKSTAFLIGTISKFCQISSQTMKPVSGVKCHLLIGTPIKNRLVLAQIFYNIRFLGQIESTELLLYKDQCSDLINSPFTQSLKQKQDLSTVNKKLEQVYKEFDQKKIKNIESNLKYFLPVVDDFSCFMGKKVVEFHKTNQDDQLLKAFFYICSKRLDSVFKKIELDFSFFINTINSNNYLSIQLELILISDKISLVEKFKKSISSIMKNTTNKHLFLNYAATLLILERETPTFVTEKLQTLSDKMGENINPELLLIKANQGLDSASLLKKVLSKINQSEKRLEKFQSLKLQNNLDLKKTLFLKLGLAEDQEKSLVANKSRFQLEIHYKICRQRLLSKLFEGPFEMRINPIIHFPNYKSILYLYFIPVLSDQQRKKLQTCASEEKRSLCNFASKLQDEQNLTNPGRRKGLIGVSNDLLKFPNLWTQNVKAFILHKKQVIQKILYNIIVSLICNNEFNPEIFNFRSSTIEKRQKLFQKLSLKYQKAIAEMTPKSLYYLEDFIDLFLLSKDVTRNDFDFCLSQILKGICDFFNPTGIEWKNLNQVQKLVCFVYDSPNLKLFKTKSKIDLILQKFDEHVHTLPLNRKEQDLVIAKVRSNVMQVLLEIKTSSNLKKCIKTLDKDQLLSIIRNCLSWKSYDEDQTENAEFVMTLFENSIQRKLVNRFDFVVKSVDELMENLFAFCHSKDFFDLLQKKMYVELCKIK